jgi:hypothetical protein
MSHSQFVLLMVFIAMTQYSSFAAIQLKLADHNVRDAVRVAVSAAVVLVDLGIAALVAWWFA